MPRSDYKRCRFCERRSDECGPLSHTRLCADCSVVLLSENVIGLHTMSGEPLKRWRRGMAACIGLTLLDDAQAAP
jgi:hypothetical protein